MDCVEVGAVAFHDEAVLHIVKNSDGEDPPMEAEGATSYVEIHTIGDWMTVLRLRTAIQATNQDQRQLLARFFDLPVIPFRLETGGSVSSIQPKSAV